MIHYIVSQHGTIHEVEDGPNSENVTKCGRQIRVSWWQPFQEETYRISHPEKCCHRCFDYSYSGDEVD